MTVVSIKLTWISKVNGLIKCYNIMTLYVTQSTSVMQGFVSYTNQHEPYDQVKWKNEHVNNTWHGSDTLSRKWIFCPWSWFVGSRKKKELWQSQIVMARRLSNSIKKNWSTFWMCMVCSGQDPPKVVQERNLVIGSQSSLIYVVPEGIALVLGSNRKANVAINCWTRSSWLWRKVSEHIINPSLFGTGLRSHWQWAHEHQN